MARHTSKSIADKLADRSESEFLKANSIRPILAILVEFPKNPKKFLAKTREGEQTMVPLTFTNLSIKSNMIVMEVIPFLLLAIGGDNIFLLLLDVNRNWFEVLLD